MKRKFLKILAAVAALVLIAVLFLLTDSFVGNPVSAWIAARKIETYTAQTYPNMDLTVGKATYNFKNGEYFCMLQSSTSKDTAFSIGYKSGKLNDRYQSEVANRFTTYRRLSDELNKNIERIIAEEFPYETEMVIGDFSKADQESIKKSLQLDMQLDMKNLPLPVCVTVYTYEENRTVEVLAHRLRELDRVMSANHIFPQEYSMVLIKRNGAYLTEDSLGVYDFSRDNLKKDNCIELLTKQIQQQNTAKK